MTTIGQKADYVRAKIREGDTQGHRCHWPGCQERCTPAQWGCRKHWYKLPLGLRNKIWHAFRPTQEVSKTPSTRYIEVAREVRAWIKEHYPNG